MPVSSASPYLVSLAAPTQRSPDENPSYVVEAGEHGRNPDGGGHVLGRGEFEPFAHNHPSPRFNAGAAAERRELRQLAAQAELFARRIARAETNTRVAEHAVLAFNSDPRAHQHNHDRNFHNELKRLCRDDVHYTKDTPFDHAIIDYFNESDVLYSLTRPPNRPPSYTRRQGEDDRATYWRSVSEGLRVAAEHTERNSALTEANFRHQHGRDARATDGHWS